MSIALLAAPIKILTSLLRKYVRVKGLNEQQSRILQLMSEITTRVDMNEFAKLVGLTSNEVMSEMNELAIDGFLKRAGGCFAITDKGNRAIKFFRAVPGNKRFNFYFAIGQPTGVFAGSIKEFYYLTQKINTISLEFHLFRGDFENWFQHAADDAAFADELGKLKNGNLKGEALRAAITKALSERYSF